MNCQTVRRHRRRVPGFLDIGTRIVVALIGLTLVLGATQAANLEETGRLATTHEDGIA